MKRTLSLLLFVTLISCSAKIIPLKGQYPATPMIFNTENSFEKSWDKLIDIFAQKGLAIKLIDKSSGLLISERSLLTATTENKEGVIVNKTAFVVIPKIIENGATYTATGKIIDPSKDKKKNVSYPVYGEWNVRIKSSSSGSTVNVNINNVTYDEYSNKAKMSFSKALNTYRSTGAFENLIYDLIK